VREKFLRLARAHLGDHRSLEAADFWSGVATADDLTSGFELLTPPSEQRRDDA
jgi:hypothetical protein